MTFQDPYSSLNPRHSVGSVVASFMEVQDINPPGGRGACHFPVTEDHPLTPGGEANATVIGWPVG